MILNDTLELLLAKHKNLLVDLTIKDVCFGVHLTAVELSDGSCGVASTLDDKSAHCAKKDRDYSELTTTKIIGVPVLKVTTSAKKNSLINTLKIAVINAISQKAIELGSYKIIENQDPIDLIDLNKNKTITVVGAFTSYINKISMTNNELKVLELDENELIEKHKRFYVPADEFKSILPKSNVVIITGFTLVNNTIDGLLDSINPEAEVIVTGPSSSLVPDALFEKGVNMIGATRITDRDLLFEVAGQYGKGYHLFEYCAQKICILNPKKHQKRVV